MELYLTVEMSMLQSNEGRIWTNLSNLVQVNERGIHKMDVITFVDMNKNHYPTELPI